VAWVSSRKDVLFMLFYLSGLIAYLRYGSATEKAKQLTGKMVVALLFVLSLLSKAMAVSFPLLLLLVDYHQHKRLTLKHVLQKWPLFAVAILYGLLTLYNAQTADAFPNTESISFAQRLLYSFFALVLYLIKIVWPLPLSAVYPVSITWAMLILSVVIVVLGAALVYYSFKRQSLTTFCFLFTLLTIWPALHLFEMNDSIIYDRFMYLPSIGMFVLIAHGLKKACAQPRKAVRWGVSGLFILWMVFLIGASHRQTRVWNNSATLWDNVITFYPRSTTAYNNMGVYMEQQGRFDEAMYYYMRLIEADPHLAEGYFKLGNILALKFDRLGALRYYSKAIEYNPKHYVAYNNRGNQYLIAEMYDRALADYTKSLEINDAYVSSYVNRGMCYFAQGNYELALFDFQKVLQLDPQHVRASEKVQYINSLRNNER